MPHVALPGRTPRRRQPLPLPPTPPGNPLPHRSRRRWMGETLASLALGSLATHAAQSTEPAAADPAAGWVDAHVHVWTPDIARYPLAAGAAVEQMQPPSFTAEELLAHARPLGVTRIVLVQMSFYGFDNRYLLDMRQAHPGVFGGIAVIDPRDQPAQRMRQLRDLGIRGFRIVGRQAPPDQWLLADGVRAMWETAADTGQAICCLIDANELQPLESMLRRYPRTPVVIDHMARIGVDGQIRPADVASLCNLAQYRQVAVKISAFNALGAKQPPYLDLAPMIRQLRDAYGAQRLMWGTDSPYQVVDHGYAASLQLVRERLDFLSDAERQALLQGTATRLFF